MVSWVQFLYKKSAPPAPSSSALRAGGRGLFDFSVDLFQGYHGSSSAFGLGIYRMVLVKHGTLI